MKWFKHDSRANRDAKIEKLLLRYGADGYALYWLCLELIAERIEVDCADFELEHDAEILGLRLKVDTLRVNEIMVWMVNNGLFEQSGERITCMKLALRIDLSTVRNPQIKAIQDELKATKLSEIVRDNPGQSGTKTELSPTTGARLDKIRLEENKREENTGTPASPAASSNPLPDKPSKHKHGSFKNVLLTDAEYGRLLADFPNTEAAIELLSQYKEMKSTKYRNDNLVLRKWVFSSLKEQAIKDAELAARESRLKGEPQQFAKSTLPEWTAEKDAVEKPTEEEYSQVNIDDLSNFRVRAV